MNQPDAYAALAALVLAKCAAYDPYRPEVTEEQARAWGEQLALHGLNDRALLSDAVTRVYSEHGSGYRPLPKDITDAARALRKERADRESTAERQAREDRLDARPSLQIPATKDVQAAAERVRGAVAAFTERGLGQQYRGDRDRIRDLVERQRAAGPPCEIPPEQLHRQHRTTAEAEGHGLQTATSEGHR